MGCVSPITLALALALLTGCATPSTPEAFCAAQADRDPAVKAALLQRVSAANFHETDALRQARAAAIAACLKHQGVLPKRAGVASQSPDRRDTLFSW